MIPIDTQVRWRKDSNNSFWKSIGSFYYTVNNTTTECLSICSFVYLTALTEFISKTYIVFDIITTPLKMPLSEEGII